jgi:hypothetical protein
MFKMFDDKLPSSNAEFKFNGNNQGKGGVAWKSKTERYMIGKVPALNVILRWSETTSLAEHHTDHISEALFGQACGMKINQEQQETLNAAMWGFLSECVGGEAETIFKSAQTLNGIDAWRRLVRYIDHGRGIRLEAMRTEMRSIHLKSIKNLEGVTVGITEFDNKVRDYVEAGGKAADDEERKNDLLAILPPDLRANLLWRATDPGPYVAFRDMVLAQTNKVF